MIPADVEFMPEAPAHDLAIESINEEAFGPGRYVRAAYRIREGGPHERGLSFVALRAGEVIASVRMTPVWAGPARTYLLGPLAVRPAHKNLGIGRRLVDMATDAARKAGADVVLLVGDEPYYGALGFRRIPSGQITMPRPVDPARLLGYEVAKGSLATLTGEVCHLAQRREADAHGGTEESAAA